ncbi:MAG TPA: undecaprenyl-phosphate glucose phosphotransferase [Sphingobacteriaceae bacterium]
MQNRFLYGVCFFLAIADLLLINGSFLLAWQICYAGPLMDAYRHQLINLNLIWILAAHFLQLYHKDNIRNIEQVLRSTWKSLAAHMVLFMTSIGVLGEITAPVKFLACFYGLCMAAFLISRFMITALETVLTRKYRIRKPVAVMGVNDTGIRLAAFFEGNNRQYAFQGFLEEHEDACYVDGAGNLLPAVCEQIRKAAARNIQEVYVSLSPDRMNEAARLLQEAEKQCVRLKFVPDFSGALNSGYRLSYLGDIAVISMRKEPLENMENRFRKRLADIVFSLMVIIGILSWLFPLIALAIKLNSRGPVLFRQLRNGRSNKPFYCFKFRSMRINADSDVRQACRDDDRVTWIGRLLRKTSLDELPQFFNVLWGDMSVVGPRPHMQKHTEQYRSIINRYMVRHYLKPGITGWAQVNGYRGETSRVILMEKRIEHDIWYLENWSMMLDVRIAFLTVIHLLRGGKNVY